jgi:hypothetical protein
MYLNGDLCVILGVSSAATAQILGIVSPPAGSGGGFARAYAVNANGTAVAGYADNAGGQDIAVRWTNLTNSTHLGFLPGGAINSYAQAIDASGTILAGYGDSGGSGRAFRWTTTDFYQVLPVAPGASPSNYNLATGISQNGAIDGRPSILRCNLDGTGCTYSAAIATGLGKGLPLAEAVHEAKMFVHRAIAQHFAWGEVHALNHLHQS